MPPGAVARRNWLNCSIALRADAPDTDRRRTTLSTRRSLVFSFIDRYATLAISIVSSMLIARLLTPTEIGIFSVAMVLVVLVNTVRDMGAGQYLLQEKELTTDRIRAVWAVQLGLGGVLAVLVLALSRPAAELYSEPRVELIMQILALNYLINPFGSVTYAWLMREMRYDSVAVMRFTSSFVGAAVGVSLAISGWGPISLAWASLATTACNAGVALFFRPRGYPWIPGLREVPRVLSFGSKVTSASIASSLSAGLPELLLGRLQSLTAAGLFSRAQGLVQMFDRLISDAIMPVAMSLFAQELRNSHDVSASFVRALSYVTALSWSFALTLVFLAHPIIRALYGDQWDDSVDLARVLAVGLAFLAPVPLCRAALLAGGAASKTLSATLRAAAVALPLTALGAYLGLLPLGGMLLAAAAIAAFIWLSAVRIVVSYERRALTAQLGRSMLVALGTALAPACAFLAAGPRPDEWLAPLVAGTFGAFVGFLVAVYAVHHPLATELDRVMQGLAAAYRKLRGQ